MPCLLCLPSLMTPYFSFFALSRRPCLIAPRSAFEHFCFPDFELDIGVTSLLTDLHHLDPSFAPTPPFFLPCLLCSQPRYSSGTCYFLFSLGATFSFLFLVRVSMTLDLQTCGFFFSIFLFPRLRRSSLRSWSKSSIEVADILMTPHCLFNRFTKRHSIDLF